MSTLRCRTLLTARRELRRAGLLVATRRMTMIFMVALPLVFITGLAVIASRSSEPSPLFLILVAMGTIVAGTVTAELWRRLGRLANLTILNEELRYRATHDPLMQVPNRDHLRTELVQALRASGDGGGDVGLLFLDLDRFKMVNDTLGHSAGDELLKAVSMRIKRSLRSEDALLARVGGDELVILMRSLRSADHLWDVGQHVLAKFNDPFRIEEVKLNVGASMGMAVAVAGESADELYRHADAALYEAKERGRGRAVIADSNLRAKRDARVRTELALRDALSNRRIEAWLQPEVDLVTGEVVAAEALARWRTNDSVELASSFIGVARQAGLLEELMVDMAGQLWDWRAMAQCELPVALNVSAAHLGTLLAMNTEHNASRPFEGLRLEIAETDIIRDFDSTRVMLNQLRSLGAQIMLDDFGAGYSPLRMLSDLPIDGIKIDRSFVERIETDTRVRNLVTSLVDYSRNTDMIVVAEGIETPRQAEQLMQMGIDRGQGYLFSRAVDFDAFNVLLDGGPLGVDTANRF